MARLEVPNPKLVSGIHLKEDPISLNGDCVDPFALIIIEEALDFAIETSLKRLESAGKIVRDVKTKGYPALQTVQGIRNAIGKLPLCDRKLTPQEQSQRRSVWNKAYQANVAIDAILAYAKEEIKENVSAEAAARRSARARLLRATKPKPKAEKLTGPVWNMMPVAERIEIAQKTGLEGKRGYKSFESFTPEEQSKLEKIYLAPAPEKKAAPTPLEKPRPEKPMGAPPEPTALKMAPLRLLAIKVMGEKDIPRQVAWGILDYEDKQTGRLTLEEGNKLLGEGNARVVL